MLKSAVSGGLDEYVDIFGQQPGIQIYTQICLCYAIPDDTSSRTSIIEKLTIGLERLSVSFPWLAGKLVHQTSSEKGNTGIFKIKAHEQVPQLVVKGLRHDTSIPTMHVLREASFPMSMLDESIIAPRRTIPGSPDEPALDSPPVFIVQANFITGGLLLTFNGLHSVMDMIGQGQIMHLLSKACRNEEFTGDELASGNLDRKDIIPLLGDNYTPGAEIAHQMVKPTTGPPPHPEGNSGTDGGDATSPAPSPLSSAWSYFIFSPSSLASLKSLAEETVDLSSGYISTDDALSAFVWQSIVRARIPRLGLATESTFARAVDVRHYLDLPATYTGMVQNMTYNTSTLDSLINAPLGTTSSRLRSALDPKKSLDLGHQTRALATVLHRSPDKSITSIVASLDSSRDLMFSSWAKVGCYRFDFGLGLGTPEAVRRPRFTPYEGLIYSMPKALDGEIAVAVCLRDDDTERLRADDDFIKYARHVG